MARTIEEIKKDMTTEWMKQPAVMSAYGLDGKKAFKDCFSAASLENILFMSLLSRCGRLSHCLTCTVMKWICL